MRASARESELALALVRVSAPALAQGEVWASVPELARVSVQAWAQGEVWASVPELARVSVQAWAQG